MQSKVKELFNKISRSEYSEQKSNPHRKNARRGRMLGVLPSDYFDVAPINDFTHFIECDVSPSICPMQFEDLKIDFENGDRRYCEYCNKHVYKADNEYMVKQLHDQGKCMAVSDTLIERLNGKMDDEQYQRLQDRLAISKLFLVYKDYDQEAYKVFVDNKLSTEEVLQAIILDILNSSDVDEMLTWYAEKGVDLEFIFSDVIMNMNNKAFEKTCPFFNGESLVSCF